MKNAAGFALLAVAAYWLGRELDLIPPLGAWLTAPAMGAPAAPPAAPGAPALSPQTPAPATPASYGRGASTTPAPATSSRRAQQATAAWTQSSAAGAVNRYATRGGVHR